MEKKKIICVVVTYNRKKWLYKNLLALLSQTRPIDEIIVVDNASTDGTYDYIAEICRKNSQIFYYKKEENTGGSGGFSWGIQKAYRHCADYIWGMDDDAIPDNYALARLVEAEKSIKETAAFWSNCDGYCPQDIMKVDTWMFVGFYIPRKIIDTVGYPRDDFFIYWDDHEYALRIQKAGYHIYKVKHSVIHHKDANKIYYPVKRIGLIRFKMFRMEDWKVYYYYRNHILTYSWMDWNKYYVAFVEIPRNFIKSFFYHNGQGKIIMRAWIDGLRSRTGKRM